MPQNEAVLVTGGAGYIGSHVILALQEAGRQIVVVDNLSTGRRAAVPVKIPFIRGDIGDQALITSVLQAHHVGAVMHFAGSIVVPESVTQPLAYYHNNTAGSLALIDACRQAAVERFVFSSTAAVYGVPEVLPVDEDAPTRPINPYGTSKLMTEWILRDAAAAHGLRSVTLRYFNVSGADPGGRAGQATRNPTHLLEVASQVATGRRPEIAIYGDDYPTPDGTCIRDYIHVSDLAAAHVAALDYLESGGESRILNCGYGRGYSVRDVLAAMEHAAGRRLNTRIAPRRPGDPAALVAKVDRIRIVLDWTPRYNDLDTIVSTALAWERRRSIL